MRDGQVVLSRRLRMLADMVTRGHRTADVGCDHGFLSIYLVQQGISPHALAMDVRKGPLAAAEEHVTACGLETYIESRLSDGLAALCPGEAETLVCAGMGGPLMEKILRDGMEKARSLKELILQPQSEIGAFRRFLRREGFRILAEDAVQEDGKYYFAMKAAYTGGEDGESPQEASGGRETTEGPQEARGLQEAAGNRDPGQAREEALVRAAEAGSAPRFRKDRAVSLVLADEYGELLLGERHPVLKQYLDFRKGVLEQLEERLLACAHRSREAEARLSQVREEIRGVNEALRQWDDPSGSEGIKSVFDPDVRGGR